MMGYDIIYLSPHLDDVALSCGGQIFDQTTNGRSVLIVTLIAGDPPETAVSTFASHLHQQWQITADVIASRRQEDETACHILQASFAHWGTLDAIYRQHPFTHTPLYPSADALMGAIHPLEASLLAALVRQLQQLPPHGRLVAPLAVGNHVDHQLTRLAAEYCFGNNLFYYEDYPYVQLPGLLETTLKDKTTWQPHLFTLSDAAKQAKLKAIASFSSQIKALFNDWPTAAHLINHYLGSVGGERVWQHRKP